MKRILLSLATVTMAFSLGVSAQQGGARHAWGDKDKDGKCDITGQPVGQGQAQRMTGAGSRGAGCNRARQGGCCRRGQAPAAQAPEAKPETKQ